MNIQLCPLKHKDFFYACCSNARLRKFISTQRMNFDGSLTESIKFNCCSEICNTFRPHAYLVGELREGSYNLAISNHKSCFNGFTLRKFSIEHFYKWISSTRLSYSSFIGRSYSSFRWHIGRWDNHRLQPNFDPQTMFVSPTQLMRDLLQFLDLAYLEWFPYIQATANN